MMTTTPLRRRLAAGALLLGPLLLGVGGTLTPSSGDDGASLVRAVSDEPGRWSAGWSVILVGAAVLLAGLAHLASRLPQRARLASIGLALFGLGTVGYAALASSELVLVPLIGDGGSSAIAAVDRISDSSELGLVFAFYLPGTLLGGLLLFAGLAVAHVLPRWAGAVGCLGVLLGFFAANAIPGGDLVSAVILSAALAPAVGLGARLVSAPPVMATS